MNPSKRSPAEIPRRTEKIEGRTLLPGPGERTLTFVTDPQTRFPVTTERNWGDLSGLVTRLYFRVPGNVGAAELATTPVEAALKRQMAELEARVLSLEQLKSAVSFAFLNTLSHPKLDFRKPIGIVIESENDQLVVARWAEALLEGIGRTQPEAMQNLRSEIIDAYDDVSAALTEGKQLAGYPAQLWALLQDLIQAYGAAAGE